MVGDDGKVTDSGEPPRKGMDDCPRLEPSPFDSFCQNAHRGTALLLVHSMDAGVVSIVASLIDTDEILWKILRNGESPRENGGVERC